MPARTPQNGSVWLSLTRKTWSAGAEKMSAIPCPRSKRPGSDSSKRLWLQTADGQRLDHTGTHGGGFANLGSSGGRLAFEYLFVDVPGKRIAIFEQMYRHYIVEDRARLYLWHRKNIHSYSARVSGFVPVPDGLIRVTGVRLAAN